jgi:hypothetical protein
MALTGTHAIEIDSPGCRARKVCATVTSYPTVVERSQGARRTEVTTLPATAGSFCMVQSPWPQQELLRLRTGQPLTLAPEGSIRAHWSRPRLSRGEPPLPVFLPVREEVVNAIPTGEHLSRPKPAGKWDRFYLPAFPAEPREPIVHVKVLSQGATTPVVCQVARLLGGRLIPLRAKARSPLRSSSMAVYRLRVV